MKCVLDRLEECVLPRVSKPNRYLSPFPGGALAGFDSASARLCLVIPEPIERALSRAAAATFLDALQQAALSNDSVLVDVCFAPAADLAQELPLHGMPLFGLGARRALGEYDVLVALPFAALQLPDLVTMLRLGGVSPRASERGGQAPALLLAGSLSNSPGAAMPYFDAALVGDPEAFADDIVRLARAWRASPAADRHALLAAHAAETGWHVPAPPNTPPARVSARWLTTPPSCSREPLMPHVELEVNGLVVEAARPTGANDPAFASAPGRAHSIETLLVDIERSLAFTGHGEILLQSTAASSAADLVPILEALNQRFGAQGMEVRSDVVDLAALAPAAARELRKGRRSALAFAPLAPSVRLRAEMGRPLSRERLIQAVDTAWRGGWAALRFQVLVGLPGESESDHEEWMETMDAAATARGKEARAPKLALVLVPFIPRPHTRWQGESVLEVSACEEIAAKWRRRLQRAKVKVQLRSPYAAAVEAALLRGEAALADVIEEISAMGVRDQADAELFDAPRWEEAWARRGPGTPLGSAPATTPWAFIDLDVPAQRGERGEFRERDGQAARGAGEEAVSEGRDASAESAGRRPRRGTRGREARQADRYRLRFSKSEPMRFTAHLDVTRAFERALRRAQLPVATSQGKDRRPKVSFGPPLPLGMTSAAEYFDVTFARDVPEDFAQALNRMLPEGLAVTAAAPVRTDPESLNSAIQIADYEVSFPDVLIDGAFGGMDFDELRDRLERGAARILAADDLPVTKVRGEETRTFNARPSLIRADVVRDDGGRPLLALRVTLGQADSARPELLTAALCDWADLDERLLRIHRGRLAIPGRSELLDPLDVVASGFAWWQQPVRGGTVR
jgi:radical SAM-linked protein